MVLTDGDRIRGLLGTYCRLVDAGDYAGVGELFAHATLRDRTPRTQHVIANTVLAEGGGPDEAVATSAYVVLQATPELPQQPVITGSYVDSFAVVDGEWRFTDRRFSIGRTGDLSHHLTFDPTPGAAG